VKTVLLLFKSHECIKNKKVLGGSTVFLIQVISGTDFCHHREESGEGDTCLTPQILSCWEEVLLFQKEKVKRIQSNPGTSLLLNSSKCAGVTEDVVESLNRPDNLGHGSNSYHVEKWLSVRPMMLTTLGGFKSFQCTRKKHINTSQI
jgi:hypothetical protein